MASISVITKDSVQVDENTVQSARVWFNKQNPDNALSRGRTPNKVVLDYLAAGSPEVELPSKKSTALVADRSERRAFKTWAKENNYEVSRETVEAWEAEGKPVPDSIVNEDVAGTLSVKPLDSRGRPNGKTYDVVVSVEQMRAHRGNRRGRAAWSDYLAFAPEGVQVLTIETKSASIALEDGELPTGDMALRSKLAEAEARIAELEEQIATLIGE